MKNSPIFSSLGALGAAMLWATASQAAPGAIAQQPLFIGNAIPPNIFFLIDDSTSMALEMMTEGFENSGRLTDTRPDETPAFIDRAGCTIERPGEDGYAFILETDQRYCDVAAEEEWRARDYTVNKLYYDPNQTYEPWQGLDADGDPFAPQTDISEVRIDPYDPDAGTIDLENESALLTSDDQRDYYDTDAWHRWCDANGYPPGRCRGWRYYYYDASGQRQVRWVRDMNRDEQTNFANWFTYHRSREYSAKYALSKVITDETTVARFGFGTVWGVIETNNRNTDNTTLIANTDARHRQTILDNLYQIELNSGTPLRRALQEVGDYYDTEATPTVLSATSPILSAEQGGSCQRNSTILMTDGVYNGGQNDNPVPRELGNEDNGGNNNTIYDEGPYGDNADGTTLADIAMYYFERDLAPAIADEVSLTVRERQSLEPLLGPDSGPEFMAQHMNTFTIGFGVKGELDPFNETPTLADSDPTHPDFEWTDPRIGGAASSASRERIDDLWHAAYNGRGEFIRSTNPQELVDALNVAVEGASRIVGSPSKVSFSSYRLTEESQVFSSRFASSDWTGELLAYDITSDFSTTLAWNGAQMLDNLSNPAEDRTIISYDGERGIPFRWNDLTTDQQNALGDRDLLDYIRGDQSQEDGVEYRIRSSLLGDIVNSGSVYVGAPKLLFPSRAPFGNRGNYYSDFRQRNQNRTPLVYVGANDGMLHGFLAETGAEALAYIPGEVYPNLADLADPEYSHRYYVDGTPTQFDAFFAPRGGSFPDWRTVLTGGLGAGGKAWYALDITDPDNFDERNADELVLWEFGEGDDLIDPTDPTELSDVGYALSQPVVGITALGSATQKRWAVITGNGYNSASGIAKLFILFLDADLTDGSWDLNEDYIEISTGVGDALNKNGLSSPLPVDSDGDWIIDHVYAGDLQGNLWAFDLSSSDSSQWGVSRNGQPLFTAINASGVVQPITARPTAIRHPNARRTSRNAPNVLVYFGTGQYLTGTDPTNTDTQSFYAVWDNGENGATLTRDDLVEQSVTTFITLTADETTDVEARVTSNYNVPYLDTGSTQRYGWFIDLDEPLAATGERVTTAASVRDGVVYFDTFIPTGSTCSPGVEVWFMTLDAVNGGTPPRSVIDLNNDSRVNREDYVFIDVNDTNGEITTTSGTKFTDGTPGGETSFTAEGIGTPGGDGTQFRKRWAGPDMGNGRISWKELRAE